MKKLIGWSLLLAVLVTGCRLPSLLPQTPTGSPQALASAHVLQGRLEPPSRLQAESEEDRKLREIAEAATVTLIDGVTGHTGATTVSNPDGTFVMRFQDGFAPIEGRPYFLEAIKGIKGRGPNTTPNDLFNQAGADAVRLRTILYYQDSPSGWISPSNASPAGITISRQTTALALALFLKQHTIPINYADFIGCLATETYQPVAGLTAPEFDSALLIVKEAILQDRDPIQFLAYDSSSQSFMNLYNGHSIDTLVPSSGGIGEEVTIIGDGFDLPGELTVKFNGVEAFLTAPPTKDRLKVKVPLGARSGPVSVRIGTVTQGGGEFRVDSFDGHRAMLDGVLYVANYDRSKIVKVFSDTIDGARVDGIVEDVADVPAGPTQLALYTTEADPSVKRLFVACRTAGKIVTLDLSAPAPLATDFVAFSEPTAMAFMGNVLYVASNTGKISRFNLDGSSAGPDLTGLTAPTALAFDYAGNLFVALDGAEDRIKRIEFNPDASIKAMQDWAYLTDPRGLAIDSGGALYVASYTDALVYRILPSLAMSVFARVPAPAGVMLDEEGFLYVASDTQHQIYRVSTLGDIKPYAFGISHPRGVAVDGNGTLYVSLSESNAILKVEDRGAAGYRTRPFVTGIANPHSITWRNDRLYIAHREAGVISSADAFGSMRTEATGLTIPGGVDLGPDGTLYAGRYGASGHAATVPPNVPWHQRGDDGGIEIVGPDGLVTVKRRILRTSDRAITGLNDGTRFAINTGTDQLVMYQATNGHNSSYRYRTIRQFGANPFALERDATGANLFVVTENTPSVYRFTGAGAAWTETVIAIPGVTDPEALTYDADNDRLYVLHGTTTIKRVLNATQPTAALDGAWSATVSSVYDLAYRAGTLFLARSTKDVQQIDLTAPTPTPTLYVDGFGETPRNIVAHPTNGELYVRSSNNQYAYRVTATKVLQLDADYTGWGRLTAYGIAPDGNRMRSESTFPNYYFQGKTTISSLIQSHEVAFHDNRVFVGSYMGGGYTGVYAYNLADGTEMFIRGTFDSGDDATGAGVLAVNPEANQLYVGTAKGKIFNVDVAAGATEGQVSSFATLKSGEWLYGLDITSTRDKLWAVGGSRSLFSLRLSDKVVTEVKPGLSQPRF